MVQEIRRAFYALCIHIDHQLRVVLGTHREEGLLDDTIILVAAHHGDMLGDFGLYAKRIYFERSANVPMILMGTAVHAVNGIGGMEAPALDAPEDIVRLGVLRFAARIWWGALAMLELQNLELGYEIQLDGSEIEDLAAFAASADTQQSFSLDNILEILRPLTINEPYRMGGDWPEDFRCE